MDDEAKGLEAELARVLADYVNACRPEDWDPGGDLYQAWSRRLRAALGGDWTVEAVANLVREIASAVRSQHQPARVAFLGPLYSYSHLAALERFGGSAELVPVASIAAVFEEVQRHHCRYGLVPLENSTDGRVVDTLARFVRAPVRICGEVPLPIHHHLLGSGTREEITEVHSKPQALSQCRQWLAQHLPHARTVECVSTAAAAQLAGERPQVAAIASREAGTRYGLNLLAENVEDQADNVTRFAVIGDHPAAATGNDKTSLMFELPHQPGALADAMAIFKQHDLNMTWIESFPMPDMPQEYLFFVEFEGHEDDPPARQAIEALAHSTVRLVLLGSYPRIAALAD